MLAVGNAAGAGPRFIRRSAARAIEFPTFDSDGDRLPACEEILERARIHELLDALVREQSPAWLRLAPGVCLPVRPLQVKGDSLLLEAGGDVLPATVGLEWTGYNSLFRGQTEQLALGAGALVLRAPRSVDRLQPRSFRRVPLSGQALLRSSGPAGETVHALELRDGSYEGLSLRLGRDGTTALVPGQLCPLAIAVAGGPPIELLGEVRAVGQSVGGSDPFLGLRILPVSQQDGTRWLDLLERQMHPRVRVAGDELEELWKLYQSTGYFQLSGKRPQDFFDIKASFLDSTARAVQAPEVALHAVWPEAGPPVATLSAVRLYETAWLGYHMAKCAGPAPDGTPGRHVLRDIHLSIYERIQRDAGARWIIGHTQVRPVWSRLCHHDLTARLVATGDAAVWRFRAVEVRNPPATAMLPAGPGIGAATPAETQMVLAALSRRLPEPMIEALDLVPRRFHLRGVRRRWWTAGLQRDRGLLVARHGSVLVAAMLLELSDEGLHVFRLLDHSLPIALASGGEAWFPALIQGARSWYFQRGREAWACFLDAHTPCDLGPDTFDLGEADMCILATERMPEFFEHLHRITAARHEPVMIDQGGTFPSAIDHQGSSSPPPRDDRANTPR